MLNQRELERPLGGFLVDLDLPRRGRLLLGRLPGLARALLQAGLQARQQLPPMAYAVAGVA